MDSKTPFDRAFLEFQANDKAKFPSWVHEIRQAGKETFLKEGFPSMKQDDWKYTSLRALQSSDFTWSVDLPQELSSLVAQYALPDALNVVLLNGVCVDILGSETGVHIQDLRTALRSDDPRIQEVYRLCSPLAQNAFTRLNDAFLGNGIFLGVDESCQSSRTIHILNLMMPQDSQAFFVRNFVNVGKGSQVKILESCLQLTSGRAAFANLVSDIFLDERAELSFAKFQNGGSVHSYVGHTRIFQRKESKSYGFFHLGESLLSREGISVKLAEKHAETRLRGIFHTKNVHHVDFNVALDHAASFTKSRQLFKGVAEDQSRGIYNAHIMVREGLHKIDAHQVSKNLILSSEAEIDAKPHLEIDSDDVKCSHGAAVGRLRPDEVFYLQTRGFTRVQAEAILSKAFTNEVIMNTKDSAFQELITGYERHLSRHLNIPISN